MTFIVKAKKQCHCIPSITIKYTIFEKRSHYRNIVFDAKRPGTNSRTNIDSQQADGERKSEKVSTREWKRHTNSRKYVKLNFPKLTMTWKHESRIFCINSVFSWKRVLYTFSICKCSWLSSAKPKWKSKRNKDEIRCAFHNNNNKKTHGFLYI